MAKLITFSTKFPSYHPKAGEPTYFVEKIWKGMRNEWKWIESKYAEVHHYDILDCTPKYHTIRSGHRFKAGDYFSPRIWSGRPYFSKQIVIAPDIEIKKEHPLLIEHKTDGWYIDFGMFRDYIPEEGEEIKPKLLQLAQNDGLLFSDLLAWFKYPQPFDGQIICWNPNINY